jgi:predicted Rossmann-fold nucleotide-binding protein
VLFDVNAFYGPLVAFYDTAVDAGLLRPVHRQLAQRAGTADEAIELASTRVAPTPHKWIDRDLR